MHGPAYPSTKSQTTHTLIPCTAQLACQPNPKSDLHPTYTEQNYMIMLLKVLLLVSNENMELSLYKMRLIAKQDSFLPWFECIWESE